MQAGLMSLCSGPDFKFLAARGDFLILDRRDGSIVCRNTLGSYAFDAIAVPAFITDRLHMAWLAVTAYVGAEPQLELCSLSQSRRLRNI